MAVPGGVQLMQTFSEVAGRVVLVSVLITAVLYKAVTRWCKKNGENTRKFVSEHQALEETLIVGLFVSGIAAVLAAAIPTSHLLVGVLY